MMESGQPTAKKPPPPGSKPYPVDAEYSQPPAKWPVIFGILSISFGAVGLFYHGAKALQMVVFMFMPTDFYSDDMYPPSGDPKTDAMMKSMMESQNEMMSRMSEAAPLSLMAAVALSLAALGLLITGIFLTMRKRGAVKATQVWAIAKICVTIFTAGATYRMMNSVMSSYGAMIDAISTGGGGAAPPPSMSAGMAGIFDAFGLAFVVIGFLWGIALPVFYLIWLNRELVKDDIENGPAWK